MASAPACNRLPDVPIELIGGGQANLAHFCGQKLVVLFCPADREAAEGEIAAYEALAPAFENVGTWVVGLVAGRAPGVRGGPQSAHIHLGVDVGGRAFRELASHFPESDKARPAGGAAFLINRDGNVRYAWLGAGHAAETLERARERPYAAPRQPANKRTRAPQARSGAWLSAARRKRSCTSSSGMARSSGRPSQETEMRAP